VHKRSPASPPPFLPLALFARNTLRPSARSPSQQPISITSTTQTGPEARPAQQPLKAKHPEAAWRECEIEQKKRVRTPLRSSSRNRAGRRYSFLESHAAVARRKHQTQPRHGRGQAAKGSGEVDGRRRGHPATRPPAARSRCRRQHPQELPSSHAADAHRAACWARTARGSGRARRRRRHGRAWGQGEGLAGLSGGRLDGWVRALGRVVKVRVGCCC
jgi:hypothetical protein